MVTLELLGMLRVVVDEVELDISAPLLCRLLVLLSVFRGQVVSQATIAAELWPSEDPTRRDTSIRSYICRLRQLLDTRGGRQNTVLLTHASGYSLDESRMDVDAHRVDEGLAAAVGARRSGDLRQAADISTVALSQFRGEILPGHNVGPTLRAIRTEYEEKHRLLTRIQIDSEIALGEHILVVGRLRRMAEEHPLDEWVHSRLVASLSITGRRSEALIHAQRFHKTTLDELGLPPGPEFLKIHHSVVSGHSPTVTVD